MDELELFVDEAQDAEDTLVQGLEYLVTALNEKQGDEDVVRKAREKVIQGKKLIQDARESISALIEEEEKEEDDEEDDEEDKVIRERKAREKILEEGDPRFQPDAPVLGSLTLPRETFTRMVNFVAPFAAEDTSRPVMCAVHLEYQDGDLYMVAADAFRLAVAVEKVGEHEPWKKQPLMPVDLLTQFVEALPGLPSEESKEVHVSFTEDVATLTCASFTSRFLLEEGFYPTWRSILPKEELIKTRVKGNAQAFLDALALVKVEAEASNMVTRWSIRDDVKIFVKEINGDREVTAFVDGATKEGIDLLVVFNHQYIIDIMNRCPEGKVTIGLVNQSKPITCTYEKLDGYLTMIMPMY